MRVKSVGAEPVECRRCGLIEIVDVRGLDQFDIQSYECDDCSVCDSCRHYDGYRCADWPACDYEI